MCCDSFYLCALAPVERARNDLSFTSFRETDRQTETETGRQTDKQTETETERQRDRETERELELANFILQGL